jgi:hypothetical protein
MSDKKKANPKNTPEHTIRCGEVTALIFVRQSNAGYAYRDIQLVRVFKNRSTGREAHGNTFFETSEHDLIQAIQEAAAWIRVKLQDNLSHKETNTAEDTQQATIPPA